MVFITMLFVTFIAHAMGKHQIKQIYYNPAMRLNYDSSKRHFHGWSSMDHGRLSLNHRGDVDSNRLSSKTFSSLSRSNVHEEMNKHKNYSGYTMLNLILNHHQLKLLWKFSEKKPLDIWSGAPGGETTNLDILVAPDIKTSFKDFLTQYNISHSVAIEDYQTLLDSQKVKVSTRESGSARKEFSLYEYNQYDEIVQYLHAVEQSCPKIVKLLSIGKTTEKRRLWLVQISTARKEARRPFVLLEAGSHAREWIGPATALHIISRLLGEDCGATRLSKYLDWHIIPLFNPDGYEYTHTRDRMWRKTRSTLENTTCKGVDVNRNFDFHWGQTGASLNPCQSDYAGPKPFSEPEARALRNYVLSDAKRILLYVSLHSYGKFLMYPWSYTKQKTSDWRIMKTLAEKANKAIIDEGGEPYFIGTAPQLLYSASGSSLDWMRGVAGVKYGFAVELPGGGKEGFDMPANGINKTAREFFAALRVFGELANKKGKIFMRKRQMRSYKRKIRRNMIRLRKFHR